MEPGQFRLLVTASRFLDDRAMVYRELDEELRNCGQRKLVVMHGDCPGGGDVFARDWALANADRGVVNDPYPAQWDLCTDRCKPGHRVAKKPWDRFHPGSGSDFCPAAGPRRNAVMILMRPDRAIGFPYGKSAGTYGCLAMADQAGIETKVVKR